MAQANWRSSTRNTESKRGLSNNVSMGLRSLLSLDSKSEEFAKSFRSCLLSEDERPNILALSEQDTRIFIEIIDRAFRAAQLDTELHKLAFSVLRKLCGRIGHLPDSYLLSDKFDLSGMPRASGDFADVWQRALEGKNVAVKSLRVSEVDDKAKIRKQFCKEVVMWKNLSHPNVLNLIGVPDTLDDGRFSMVSEWMANGNIMEYVLNNTGNHLKLLADATGGLKYLHDANIVHGDLKGANILITNANPVTACLTDFEFATIVCNPSLGMESSEFVVGGGATPFMAPELLVPSRFGLDKCTPTKEADIYAMATVIYQVLTGTLPFGESGSEAVFRALAGAKPSKPANAPKLGLSDEVWKLLEDCWQTDRTSRPSIEEVSDRVKVAASVCGILSTVGGMPQRYEDPDSDFAQFDSLFLGTSSDDEEFGVTPMERPPSQGSILTGTLSPDSLYSELSEVPGTEGYITKPSRPRPDAVPDVLFNPVLDHIPHFQVTLDSARPFCENSSPYKNRRFVEPSSGGQKMFAGGEPTQREQPRSDAVSTVIPHDRVACPEKSSAVRNLVASSFLLASDATGIAMGQARVDPTCQLHRPSNMLSLYSSKSRPIEAGVSPHTGDHAKQKPRQSRFHIRQRIGKVFTGDAHK